MEPKEVEELSRLLRSAAAEKTDSPPTTVVTKEMARAVLRAYHLTPKLPVMPEKTPAAWSAPEGFEAQAIVTPKPGTPDEGMPFCPFCEGIFDTNPRIERQGKGLPPVHGCEMCGAMWSFSGAVMRGPGGLINAAGWSGPTEERKAIILRGRAERTKAGKS